MPCPICGDDCRCAPATRSVAKSKFEIEPESDCSILIDPEAYDASEQEFAASLEQVSAKPRFVVEPEDSSLPVEIQAPSIPPEAPAEPPFLASPEPAASESLWKEELAAKLNHYRARRSPKQPRFPSLQLKFETEATRQAPIESPVQPVLTQQAIPVESQEPPAQLKTAAGRPRVTDSGENSARILEFPRIAVAPPRRMDELADPVLDRPRILEVPDTAPPEPALGGITIGPVERIEPKPSEFEVPLQAASLSRRFVATALDAVVIASSVVLFSDIYQSMTPNALTSAQFAAAAAAFFGVFWAAYHFLLLVYCGTTLGLRLTRMQLRHFDGKPVLRNTRRWRAVTAVLSAACLGLGYAWCLLDEDQLCWHDRITRTYVSPQSARSEN
jgi:uncharacterized RDD family membrane protein YckC